MCLQGGERSLGSFLETSPNAGCFGPAVELRPPPCTTEEREDPEFALQTEPGNTLTERMHGQKPPTF